MIVDPDFVDHWKTRTLVAMLDDDEVAPVYVIRLWAHCQNRRTWVFEIPPAALKAICRFPGDAHRLESSLIDCGFVTRDGNEIEVVGWEEYNASLIASWANGSKGGRPKKVKSQEGTETHVKPMGNPAVNQQETHGLTDKSREDKSREVSGTSSSVARGSRLPKDWYPSDEDATFCKAERPDLDVKQVANEFRDYWTAKTGKDAAKLDWPATWRNWVRRQRVGSVRSQPTYHDERADVIAQMTGRKPAHQADIARESNEQFELGRLDS